ncbi:Enoyl-[acyl-carrier-protein] reductase [NADH] [Cohaesibacter sp. ES.047]|uniref:enoyl-ACP reductase FabI n=1 Tax=Cohaesibacter sp. ES.047 TaxID=1798205 RepID=UPI000BBFD505|nr:SDR family oxidoreductase [Cohaesibacter sp. ES.047]SNY90745.1 Enoyl-[acyl-carrier-protein] reductase [NADH] [Cohaesibacter sp. ES.047]
MKYSSLLDKRYNLSVISNLMPEAIEESVVDAGNVPDPVGKALVVGVSSRRSIGFGIAEHLADNGWETVVTTRRKDKFEQVSQRHDVRELDYTKSYADIDNLNDVTGLVFCIAKSSVLSPKGLLETSREEFSKTMLDSCYSYISVVNEAVKRNPNLKSIVGLSFLGGEKVVPGYDAIGVAKAALEHANRIVAAELGERGIRANIVSSGSVRTPASRVLPDFSRVHEMLSRRSFLKRAVTTEEVAGAVEFLLSDASGGMTGEVLQVNGGISHSLAL